MTTFSSYISNDAVKYDLAVALNNTAVALLEKNRYHDAVEALQAATSVIQGLQSSSGDCYSCLSIGIEETTRSPESAWRALSKASQRLSCPQTATERERLMLSPADLFIISNEYYYDPGYFISSNLFSDSTEFAMRIDDHQDTQNYSNVDVDAAAILLNYGTACRCCMDFTRCTPEEEDCEEILDIGWLEVGKEKTKRSAAISVTSSSVIHDCQG